MSEALSRHIDAFLDHLSSYRHMAENTIAAYQNDLRQFSTYIALSSNADADTTGAGRIEPGVVASFVLDLRERGYADATVARKIAAVKSFFHYAKEAGHITHNPAASLDAPRVKRSAPRAARPADVRALIDIGCSGDLASDLRDRAMLTLLYQSGMRVTELVSLDIDDLDPDAAYVHCHGRTGRVRAIPLGEEFRSTLIEYLRRARPILARSTGPNERALFLNRRGSRLTRQGFWLIMRECAQRAGVHGPLTPHSLRHSFALQHLDGGATLRDLKELLGHVNISTTQIYALTARGEAQTA